MNCGSQQESPIHSENWKITGQVVFYWELVMQQLSPASHELWLATREASLWWKLKNHWATCVLLRIYSLFEPGWLWIVVGNKRGRSTVKSEKWLGNLCFIENFVMKMLGIFPFIPGKAWTCSKWKPLFKGAKDHKVSFILHIYLTYSPSYVSMLLIVTFSMLHCCLIFVSFFDLFF